MLPVEQDRYGLYRACIACGCEVEVKRPEPKVDWSKLKFRRMNSIRRVMR